MIVVVSRTIIIKAISIPIIQNRIESECHFLIILFFLFFYSSKVKSKWNKKKKNRTIYSCTIYVMAYAFFFIETYPSHLNN